MIFLAGMMIGLAIAAPVGPVGLLCIRRALADGRVAAFVAGLGAAAADTFYGGVAAFGVSFISDFLFAHQAALKLIGGLFLAVIGLRTYRSVPSMPDDVREEAGLIRDFLATFAITLTNPGTILAFMAAFATLGTVDSVLAHSAPHLLVMGVFGGSALWWMILSTAAAAVRARFTPRWLKTLNRGSGVAILIFGAALLASLAI